MFKLIRQPEGFLLIDALLGLLFLAVISTVITQSFLNCRFQAQLTADKFEADSREAEILFNGILQEPLRKDDISKR